MNIYQLKRLASICGHFGINLQEITTLDKQAKEDLKKAVILQFDLQKDSDALLVYQELLRKYPTCWEVRLLKGIALCQLKDYQKAVNTLGAVTKVETNPKAQLAVLNALGFSMRRLGRYQQAWIAYNKALNIDPNNKVALTNREQLKPKIACNNITQFRQKVIYM